MVTPQELVVCGESIEINGEKLFHVPLLRKKLFAFIRSEKNCMFKLAVEKRFDNKEKPYPPPSTYQMVLS